MKKHTDTLPVDLIIEILVRLPVKSVLRFKCVCKSWLYLISNSQFGISHHDLAAAPSHRLLFRSNDYYIESIDTEAQLEKDSSGVHLVLPPPSPPCYRSYYNCYHHVRMKPEILGSCRGLLLLFYERSHDLILWNPSIGVHKRLQDAKFFEMTCEFLYGFGYDASQDDYLLILISWPVISFRDTKTNIKVFSLKTYSWNIYDSNVSCSVLVDNKDGSLLNGAIHWLVFSEDKKVPVIMAFDLIQRSLSDIPLFDHFAMEFSMMKYQAFSLRVLGEALSLCFSVRDTATTEIWVMKEYKVKSSWTKFIVIPTNDCFSLICITKDGGILGSNIYGRLEKRNDKGELLEDLMHHGEERLYLANLQSAMYRESLVSLPSVIGGNK